jgi:hypothetical protein
MQEFGTNRNTTAPASATCYRYSGLLPGLLLAPAPASATATSSSTTWRIEGRGIQLSSQAATVWARPWVKGEFLCRNRFDADSIYLLGPAAEMKQRPNQDEMNRAMRAAKEALPTKSPSPAARPAIEQSVCHR